MKLTGKQEKFARLIFEGMPQRKAYIEAGYSTKNSLVSIDVHASQLTQNAKVKLRIDELKQKAENDSIMSVLERKQRLSEIARAKLTDFMELGQDGSWVNIGAETPRGAAIQEIHSTTQYDKDGSKPTIYTSVKLHDPMKAIDLLNKMGGDYPPTRTEITGKDGEAIQVDVNAKTKLIGLLSYGTTRLREGEDTKPAIGEGSTKPTLRLDSVGKTESDPS